MGPLDRVRRIRLGFPEATEKIAWGVIEGLLREGYLEIAPKRRRDQLPGTKPAPRARPAGEPRRQARG